MSTFKELIRQVKSEIREVSVEEARLRAEKGAVLVDVREADEWSQGHVPGAVFIPRGFLELRVEEKVPDKAQEVILYCAGGTRSALAAKSLADLGYANVSSMAGGFGKWKEAGFPIVVPKTLTAEQKNRYSRHLLVPEVGEAGQARLLASKVAAGGRGRPRLAGRPLPRGGGRGHASASSTRTWWTSPTCSGRCSTPRTPSGKPKTESAEATIRALNPDVKVVRHDLRLDAEQRDGRDRALRRDRRRLRQLHHQVPRQRRGRALGQDQRLRQHLPLRRPGLDLRGPATGPATAASTRSRRRPSWRRRATRPASSACCPASSASSRPRRRSRRSWARASR